MTATTRFVLAAGPDPDRVVQRAARSARAAAAAVAPGHEGAGRARRSRAAVPDGAHRAGDDAARRPIDIPGEVLDILRLWRPTPLVRARRLEAGARHAGAHLLQGRVGVARRVRTSRTPRSRRRSTTSRTGTHAPRDRDRRGPVGDRRSSFACAQFDLECKVYMVRASYEQKPYRRVLMETWGATVVPSPVDDPTIPGSLGAAISDAVRDAAHARRLALLARLGAQPRAAAPDGHRARGEGAAAARGRGRAPTS